MLVIIHLRHVHMQHSLKQLFSLLRTCILRYEQFLSSFRVVSGRMWDGASLLKPTVLLIENQS